MARWSKPFQLSPPDSSGLAAGRPLTAEENVDVVRRMYDAWARDDFPGPAEALAADVEYVSPQDAVEPGVRRGITEFLKAIENMSQGWESWRMEPVRFVPVGDSVAVVVRYRARGRASGVEVEGVESALWTLRAGRVIRYAWFNGPEDALRAAGG